MELKHGIAYQCRTELEASQFMKLARSQGYTWALGDNFWDIYEDATCYDIGTDEECTRIYYCDRDWYEKEGWPIVPFMPSLSLDIV